jgi:hypothetical protein
MATPQEIAQWMSEQIDSEQVLTQKHVVYTIQSSFGTEHIYINRHGNQAIVAVVLEAFKNLRPDVVWSRSRKNWRIRDHKHDAPGREQRYLTEAEQAAKEKY